jgi:CxxC motif-containing protein (DUF1111 family)
MEDILQGLERKGLLMIYYIKLLELIIKTWVSLPYLNQLILYSGLEVDPEVSTQTVHDVVFYLKTLKAPIQRNQTDPDVMAGKQLFTGINCASCHTPTLTTGYSPISVLSNKEFHPYTDLLLHDMGNELDDGYTEGYALTSEWRTPPLWGLGLSKDAQGGMYFLMHDGRALALKKLF